MAVEFDIIRRCFAEHQHYHDGVLLGIGDDAALCTLPEDMAMAVSTDTLVAGIHFSEQTDPYDIGYKALAVNLSDMAAMGATPAWFTLALTCPQADEDWLVTFSEGLMTLAHQTGISLIGGDTTRGPLNITVQIIGFVPPEQALRRCGAQPGDHIYVTGTLGDAGLGLASVQSQISLLPEVRWFVEARLNRPQPRIAEGLALRNIASSAIDISDGLLADLNHLLVASSTGAIIQVSDLPLSNALRCLPPAQACELALSAGDDYELCFTVPPYKLNLLSERLKHLPHTCIGLITAEPGLNCLDAEGRPVSPARYGYQHF